MSQALMRCMSSRSRRRPRVRPGREAPLAPGLNGIWYRESPPSRNYARINPMTESHLKLVDPSTNPPDDAEFIPLPYYNWETRPSHLPLDVEEVATALYLAGGLIGRAAERLKTEPLKVVRAIARSARLQRLHAELASLLHAKVHEEDVRAFGDEGSRRREWAASKVVQTKGFQAHPLAPNSNLAPNSLVGGGSNSPMRIVISWDARAGPLIEQEQAGD